MNIFQCSSLLVIRFLFSGTDVIFQIIQEIQNSFLHQPAGYQDHQCEYGSKKERKPDTFHYIYWSHNTSKGAEKLDISGTKHPKIEQSAKNNKRNCCSCHKQGNTSASISPYTDEKSCHKRGNDPAILYLHLIKIHKY